MTSKDAFKDIYYINEALRIENHFHIGEKVMNIMKELVERDTPMKPIDDHRHVFTQYNCRTCGCRLDIPQLKEINFCPKCGQKIDWSEE